MKIINNVTLSNKAVGYYLIAPALIILLSMLGFPILKAIYLSFTDKQIGSVGSFVGIKNYQFLLTNHLFWRTFFNTLKFTLASVSIKLILGFILALTLNEINFLTNLSKSLLLVPWIIPTVISSLIWLWMYYDLYGVLNYVLINLNLIKEPISWLGSSNKALSCLIFVNVWREIPFFGLCILAGINSIPKNIVNSAKIDGANYLKRLVNIVFPNIKNVIVITSSLSLIWTMGEFQIVHIITKGGPANATQIFTTLIYEFGFRSFDIAKAMAVAVIYFPLLLQLLYTLKKISELSSK